MYKIEKESRLELEDIPLASSIFDAAVCSLLPEECRKVGAKIGNDNG
jgi:hypothetical protein